MKNKPIKRTQSKLKSAITLQQKNLKLQIQIDKLQNKILKLENKTLKLEQKVLKLFSENARLKEAKGPLKFTVVTEERKD